MKLPPSISLIVTKYDHLKQLRDQAVRLDELDDRLKMHVPTPLSKHIRLATIRDGLMVVHADSSAWAAQLRFKTPEILEQLTHDPLFEPIRSIRIRSVSETAPQAPIRSRPSISSKTAAALKAQASSIADSAVRDALMRLAMRAKD
ncbi:MAG: DUF721 domain-containing protein [Proteobacteria bacterium]|nr:DUF721 domain-containing protein [Pseudomonadota bacterium]